MIEVVYQLYEYDPVGSDIMSTHLSNPLSMQSIIKHADSSDEFRYISDINSKRQDSITPEELSSRLCHGINTAAGTIKANTHQYILTTGLLTKRFCTCKAHLLYKQFSRQYGTFYTDFLKVQVRSIHGYCGGLLYINKIGFK